MKKKPLLLIVEDDSILAETMKDKFQEAGFTVKIIANGQLALNYLKENIPQVILLDLLLPQIGGFDVLFEIKNDQKLKQIPVVIASNLDSENDLNKGYALGAGDYIVKSNLSLSDLVQKVNFLFNMSQHGRNFLAQN